MDYNKLFTKIMYSAKNPMEGAIDIFNTIAYEREFEHRALKLDNSGNYISDDESWTPETVYDIIKELKNPGLDPRNDAPEVILRSDVLTIDDLKIGMELKGTVRNVASFGAFVDIGLHDDGLLHISKMSKTYVKDPKEIVNVGDIITVYVSDINKEKEKIQLSLLKI